MPATAMNHFTILTDQLDETVKFYGELLELEPGAVSPGGTARYHDAFNTL